MSVSCNTSCTGFEGMGLEVLKSSEGSKLNEVPPLMKKSIRRGVFFEY